MARILIVQGEQEPRVALGRQLTGAGHRVTEAGTGGEALQRLAGGDIQLAITDWSLPDMSGRELLEQLRRDAGPPELRVLVLAANPDGQVAAQALEQGADDFIAQPASPPELLARVTAALRRSPLHGINGTYRVGPIRLDKLSHRVTVGGQPIELAPAEYRLIAYFMEHPGHVHDRRCLLEKVWGRRRGIGERTVDVHVRRLRALLEPYGCDHLLQTVRGFGYRFGP